MSNHAFHAVFSKQRGFSLLELSIFIVFLGIGAVAFWKFSNLKQANKSPARQTAMLHRADRALTGYLFSQQRLPCPAESPTSGVEQCANNLAIGYLPYKTLGLPDKNTGLIRYGVLRRAHNVHDADLTQRKPRFQILHFNPGNDTTAIVTLSPNSNTQTYGAETGVYAKDFCSALSAASAYPFSKSFVHINGSTTGSQQNVAYALALSKPSGQTFTQDSTLPSLTFGSPTSNPLSTEHDVVLAISPQTLSTRLSCASLISAIRSYANIQLSAAIYTRTLPDYLNQLDITVDKARASKIASSAGLARASANALNAASALKIAIAESLRPKEFADILGSAVKITMAGYALKLSLAGMAASSIGLPLATLQYLERATNNYNRVNDKLIPQANALKLQIDERFFRAVDAGIYLPVSAPPQN